MTGELSPIDKAKFVAAKRAADYVEDGMRVGLGTGSTAAWLVRCLGDMVRDQGLKFRGVPTSTVAARVRNPLGVNTSVEGVTESSPPMFSGPCSRRASPSNSTRSAAGGAFARRAATKGTPVRRSHSPTIQYAGFGSRGMRPSYVTAHCRLRAGGRLVATTP